jgi:Flp pilus assembly protein TadG
MHRSNRSTEPAAEELEQADADGERGSAALEFIVVGLLMLAPLVYLVVTLGLIQQQSLGAEAGARHVARAISTAVDAADARDRADRVLAAVIEEYGLGSVDLQIECAPAGVACPAAGATLVVTIRTQVALPLVPPVLGLDHIASVPVEASAAHKVSRFWGTS